MSNENDILGGTVMTVGDNIVSQEIETKTIVNNDEIQKTLLTATDINQKIEMFLENQKNIDNDSNVEEELENIDINSMLNDLDFVIVLKSKEPDVHFIVPQLNDYENMEEELKANIAQNHFLLGFINFALNNENWIEEYSQHVINSANQDFENNLSDLGILSDLQNLFNNMSEVIEKNSSDITIDDKDLTDKLIDFREAVEKMNNKPKIIT